MLLEKEYLIHTWVEDESGYCAITPLGMSVLQAANKELVKYERRCLKTTKCNTPASHTTTGRSLG